MPTTNNDNLIRNDLIEAADTALEAAKERLRAARAAEAVAASAVAEAEAASHVTAAEGGDMEEAEILCEAAARKASITRKLRGAAEAALVLAQDRHAEAKRDAYAPMLLAGVRARVKALEAAATARDDLRAAQAAYRDAAAAIRQAAVGGCQVCDPNQLPWGKNEPVSDAGWPLADGELAFWRGHNMDPVTGKFPWTVK